MEKFRKLYYKLVTLFCLFATFFYVFNMDKRGVGYGCFYIFVRLFSFGSLSIGKKEIDPEKPIGAINEKWVYKSIDKETADLIKRQITETDKYSYNTDNPFGKDVEIVVCGDKKYYVA